jgi:hypothetical protein
MDETPLFQGVDEQERLYAPQQLPPEEQDRVLADEGAPLHMPGDDLPVVAPASNLGQALGGARVAPDSEHEADGTPDPPRLDTPESLETDRR